LRQPGEERFPQAVLPAAHGLADLALERFEIRRERLAGIGRDRDREARERGFRHADLRLDTGALQAAQQDLLDALAGAPVVLITGHIDEARIEAPERIAAREE